MTDAIAKRARELAISIEVKKDRMAQRQSGDWVIGFVVNPNDLTEQLMRAPMGTRYMACLVEVDDDGTPKSPEAVNPYPVREPTSGKPAPDKPPPNGRATARAFRDMTPTQQAGMLCGEAPFWRFLEEKYPQYTIDDKDDAAGAVRELCEVRSRSELTENHKARLMWQLIASNYLGWKRAPSVVGV